MLCDLITKNEVEYLIPSKQKMVFEYSKKALDIVKDQKYYISDNEVHVFLSSNSDLMQQLLKVTKNVSLVETGLIDFYMYKKN